MAETHKLGGRRGKQPIKCHGGVGAEENCETGEQGPRSNVKSGRADN